MQSWLRSALGQRVYALERKLAGEALAQVFGWQLLQIGLWGDDDGLLAERRTQRKAVLAWHGSRPADRSRADPLPHRSSAIASDCVDAVGAAAHARIHEPEPHEILREVGRISPRKVISSCSASGRCRAGACVTCSRVTAFRRARAHDRRAPAARLAEAPRLRDRRCAPLPVRVAARLERALSSQSFFERSGRYLWPIFAGGYLIKARKRVYTLTPVLPRWRLRPKVVGGLIEPTTRGSG